VQYVACHQLEVLRPGTRARVDSADALLLDELHRVDLESDEAKGLVIGWIDRCYARRRPLLAACSVPFGSKGTGDTGPTGLNRILGVEVAARFRYRGGIAGESYRQGVDTTFLAYEEAR
jgi:hypothetical protein